MTRRFFISAMREDSDILAQEIDAESFEHALLELSKRAAERWPGPMAWRPTSITEVPDRNPIGMVFRFLGEGVGPA